MTALVGEDIGAVMHRLYAPGWRPVGGFRRGTHARLARLTAKRRHETLRDRATRTHRAPYPGAAA